MLLKLQQKLQQFCDRNFIIKLSLFGSILRNDFTEQSDIDFLTVRGRVGWKALKADEYVDEGYMFQQRSI